MLHKFQQNTNLILRINFSCIFHEKKMNGIRKDETNDFNWDQIVIVFCCCCCCLSCQSLNSLRDSSKRIMFVLQVLTLTSNPMVQHTIYSVSIKRYIVLNCWLSLTSCSGLQFNVKLIFVGGFFFVWRNAYIISC